MEIMVSGNFFPVTFVLPNLHSEPFSTNTAHGVVLIKQERMNTNTQFEEHTDLYIIIEVKKQVDEIYARRQIFGLSLETLELTRRFNNQYMLLEDLKLVEPVAINKFVSLTQHLERNLSRELL